MCHQFAHVRKVAFVELLLVAANAYGTGFQASVVMERRLRSSGAFESCSKMISSIASLCADPTIL